MTEKPPNVTSGDVDTARLVLETHRPFIGAHGVQRCAHASHAQSLLGPRWPCIRYRAAQRTVQAAQPASRDQAADAGATP